MTQNDHTKPLSEAADIEEFKNLRAAQRTAAAEPAAEKAPQSEEDTPVIAADKGTANETVQEQVEPTEKSVEDQVKDLRAKGKHAAANKLMVESAVKAEKERADKLQQEVEALRSRPAEPHKPEAKPSQEAAAAQPQSDPSDPEPQATDKKYEGPQGYERYLRDCGRWDTRQENRQAETKRQQTATAETINRKLAAARTKYPDFDTATAGDMKAGTGLVLTPPMWQFAQESDAGMDVVYHLGKNPAEALRIKALSPTLQLAELGYMARLLTAPPAAVAATPEKLKPAVSRAAPPPRVLSGSDAPPPKALSEARDFEEHKRIRHAKAS